MIKNVKGGVPMPRHLYIMLSRTDTGMGRLIRFFTKETYNHVSLCLDDRLDHFVSFARFRQDVPLAGGYVAEPPERLLSCGKTMPVRIFKLDISPKDAEELEAIFALAGHKSNIRKDARQPAYHLGSQGRKVCYDCHISTI